MTIMCGCILLENSSEKGRSFDIRLSLSRRRLLHFIEQVSQRHELLGDDVNDFYNVCALQHFD